VGFVVVLEVLPSFARLDPGDAGHPVGVGSVDHLQDGLSDRTPLIALLSAKDPPTVGGEPVGGGAGNYGAQGVVVNAKVVPVHHVVEVVQGQAPGRVLGLVRTARGQAGVTLEGKDLDLTSTGSLEGKGLPSGWWRTVARGAGVEFQKEGLALHLGVAGKAFVVPELQQVFPVESPLCRVGDEVLVISCLLVFDPQGLVEHGQRGVDEGDGMAGDQYEAVAEPLLGVADVPSHHPAE